MKKKASTTKRAKAKRPASARRPSRVPRRHVIIEPDDPDFDDVTAECLRRGETGIAVAGVSIPRDDED